MPGETLAKKLSEVEEAVYQVRNQSNQDPLNFPIKLNNQIAALRRSIETGDGRPTAQSYVVFKELSAQLDALLAKLNELVSKDLEQLNKSLIDRKLEPIRTRRKGGAAEGGSRRKGTNGAAEGGSTVNKIEQQISRTNVASGLGSKSSSFRRRLEVGKGGLPPLLSKRAIRKSGGKPPFPTSTILPALVSHKTLEFGTPIPRLKVELIPKKIRGREGRLAPATFKARDSEERGQAALPYLYNSTCLGFP